VTSVTSLAKGYDPRYLTEGQGAGHAGGTRYYAEAAGEPPGRWGGRAAAQLGLAGDVDADTMQALYMDRVGPDGQRLDARQRPKYRPADERVAAAVAAHQAAHPFSTEGDLELVRATERAKAQHSVPYFDFTISAAKSVSVLHASLLVAARQARAGGRHGEAGALERDARAITDALEAAARAALSRAERALYVRTGYHSATSGEYRDTAGGVVASFLQHTSREGDPQLHVHNAVLNLAQRADGADAKWRTLHGALLYQERLAVAAVAVRELATRLTSLGYVLIPRADGNGFEVGGVSQEVMDAFSSRRAQITPELARMAEEYRQRYGREPSQRTLWAMAQDATLASRKVKQHGRSDRSGVPPRSAGEELDAWEAATTQHEVEALSAVHAAVRAFAAPEDLDRPEVLSAQQRGSVIRRAVDGAQHQAAAFTRAALLWEVHRAMPAMAAGVDQAALAEELAAEAVSSGAVLALGPAPDVTDVAALGVRASDGQSVFTPPGAERYTTPAHLDLEEYLVAEAAREVPQLITPGRAELALGLSDLDSAQAEVAAGLLAARTAVSVLVAPAGSGKTHTMAAFARAWTQWTGGRAIGVTLSTNAARVMADEGMTQAVNIAQFLGRLKDGGSRGAMRLTPQDVVVVDEASQVSTEDLAAILAVVRAAGARAILTGDTAQLGAVDAGGMMRLLAADLGHWELAEVRRFDAQWEADASLQLRQGGRAALQAYDAHGRVRGADRAAAMRDAVALYLADHLMGRDALLLAGTNEEAAELATMVRAELARHGRVPEKAEVRLADGNGAGRGDLLRARENSPLVEAAGRPLTNRDTLRLDGTTLAAGGRVALARRQLADGSWSRQFPVPLDYLARSAELAYAGNVYVSQGRTVDTSHVYVSPSLSREALYVAMTRGRSANTAHVSTGPSPARGQEPMAQADPLAVLAEVLDRTSSATTATEAMREAQAFATHSGHLLTLWSAAVRPEAYAVIDQAVQERLAPAEWARYQAEPQRPVFQRQVLGAVLAGTELGTAVDVATARDFTGARSVSAVMHGRLEAAGYRPGQSEAGRAWLAEAEARADADAQAEREWLLQADAPARAGAEELAQWQAGRLEPVTWAARVPEGIKPEAAQLGRELGAALDARGRELATGQAEQAEPWVLETLGAFPAEGSPALQADWLARVGQAAVYREAAGITHPREVVGPVPGGHPELAAAHAEVVRLLELRAPDQFVWAVPRVQLEQTVAAYERVQAAAPREVSAELRAERLAEADARARALELRAQGLAELAAGAEARADAGDVRATGLEGQAEAYTSWAEATAAERAAAELAQAELNRRGTARPQVSEREPEMTAGEPTPEAAGQQAEAAAIPAEASAQLADTPEAETEALAAPGAGREDLDLEAVGQLPELDTTTVSGATAARLEELEARKAALAEAAADEAQRKASREAYAAAELAAPAPEAESPSAWVPGPATPEYGGAQTAEPAAAEPEPGL
jgi:conjugative relaxase-like TrwC/TraI family protein